MKKAKIMLMAIAVLAFVGGIFAFKVKTAGGINLCTTLVSLQQGTCSFESPFLRLVPEQQSGYFSILYTTKEPWGECDPTPNHCEYAWATFEE